MEIEFKNTKELVKKILEEDTFARDSDDFLIMRVYACIKPDIISEPFSYVISARKYYHLPTFETIRRVRQKLQQENPHLRGCDKVNGYRKDLEKEYCDFFKN